MNLRKRLSLTLWSILVGLVVLWGTPLRACDPEPGPQHFFRPVLATPAPPPPVLVGCFEVHNTLNGLPANEIRCVLTGDGWVMAGSDGAGLMIREDGVWRTLAPGVDGKGFPARTVTSLVQLPDGAVMAGTPAGLVKLSREGTQWRMDNNPLTGATSRNLLSLMPTTEGMLVGTDNGAGIVLSNALNPFRLEGGIMPTGFASCVQRGGDILYGCSHGLFLRRGDMLIPYPIGDTDLGWVNALLAMGETLAVGGSKGLVRVRGSEASPILPELWITALGAAPGGTDIQIDTPDRSEELAQLAGVMGVLASAPPAPTPSLEAILGDKLKRLDEIIKWAQNPSNWNSPNWGRTYGEFWELFDSAQQIVMGQTQLPSPPIQPLLKGLWVGTQQDGVILFATDGKQRHFTRENSKLPSNRVTCISTADSGETWIGTADGGLLRYFRQPLHLSPQAIPVFEGKVEALELMGDRLFVGTSDQGLLVFDPGSLVMVATYTNSAIKGFHRKVTGVGLDPSGRLWVGGDTGVWRLDDKGWRHLPLVDPRWLPGTPPSDSLPASVLAVDGSGRVFAAAELSRPLSEQVFHLVGERFVSFSRETIKRVLAQSPASAALLLKALGLTDTWNNRFDAVHASMSLAIYEKSGDNGKVSALLDTANYLLIGTQEHGLTIFDGQSFKRLSPKGSGVFGPIVAVGKRGNGDLLILGENLGQDFDGEHYRPIPSIPGATRMSDLVFDDLNTDCFWVSWRGTGSGGFGLNQGARWISLPFKEPVLKLAVLDPWIFIATPSGVYRLNKR